MMEVATHHPAKAVWGALLLLAFAGAAILFPFALGYDGYLEFIEASRRGLVYAVAAPLSVALTVPIGLWTLCQARAGGRPAIEVRDGAIIFSMPFFRSIPLAEVADVIVWKRKRAFEVEEPPGQGIEVVLKDGRRRQIGTVLCRETPCEIRRRLLEAVDLPVGS